MSSVSSVGGLNFNPWQYLASVNSQSAAASSGSSTTTAATGASGATSSGSSSLQTQLATAINSAVQTAENSGSTSSLQSVIQNAVNQVLQNNGIDSQSALQTSGQAQGTHHRHHHGGGGSAGQSGDTTSSQTTGSTSSDGTTSAANSATSTGTTGTTTTQQASLQQLADLLAQITGSSGGNQSVSGFLFAHKPEPAVWPRQQGRIFTCCRGMIISALHDIRLATTVRIGYLTAAFVGQIGFVQG